MIFYFADAARQKARVVIVGMPLDRTSSYISGTRFGPNAARIGADNIESFSPYQHRDIAEIPVHDSGNLEFSYEKPDAPVKLIAKTTRAHYRAGKKQLAIGGEHTIAPAIISELSHSIPNLCVIQFDAHSDLRDDYLGEKWCHATAMRRVLEYIPRQRLFQIGIRSFSRPEEMNITNIFPFELLSPTKQVMHEIGSRPAYITLDLDVLDPGTLPDVQTPQPGGCSYQELVRALIQLSELNIVGCDIAEFCPCGCHPSPGSSLVAELIRELALLLDKK
ncbi:agmatinase [candidate division WOR-3 bacterium JGI_Cruoil_03_51_56]|uniref:Agmatinase n=1 Tax=candidate division WOR-3 bacterium JGI_Cruoil_03_51_56 TaxID=1973747 RepID=A0A235BX38_UNCW3|nr:MAG: agmatinase [candidate division WOR-3 bacterium JGI_Cruoil_03_51_56]